MRVVTGNQNAGHRPGRRGLAESGFCFCQQFVQQPRGGDDYLAVFGGLILHIEVIPWLGWRAVAKGNIWRWLDKFNVGLNGWRNSA